MPVIGPHLGAFYALLVVVALVIADWLLGILAALRTGTFTVQELPRQLVTFVLPYVGSLFVVWAIQWFTSNYASPGTAAAGAATLFSYFADATIVPKCLTDIAAKLAVIGSAPVGPAAVRAPLAGGPPAPPV